MELTCSVHSDARHTASAARRLIAAAGACATGSSPDLARAAARAVVRRQRDDARDHRAGRDRSAAPPQRPQKSHVAGPLQA